MYDHNPDNPANQLDHDLAFSSTLLGKECQKCRRAYCYNRFNKSSSSRDGYSHICPQCEKVTPLSTSENTARIREANFSAVENQRRPDEEDYLDRDPVGKSIYTNDLISKIRQAGVLVVAGDAHFANEVSLYVQNSQVENGYQYVGWLPVGLVQEFSEYEYNEYSVPVWETVHGYRGVLKNLIANGYLTEQKCDKVFGHCDEKVWAKTMWELRNKH
jgi:hypothetical protein